MREARGPAPSRVRRRSARRPRAARERRAGEGTQDLRGSLESTRSGLATLLASLEQSGFHEAAGPYRDMHVVLVQQRLWSRNHGRDDLEPLWSEIAETASRIEAILAGFAAVMGELGDVDRIEPDPSGAVRRDADATLELARVFTAAASVSGPALRAQLPWPADVRRRRLSELVRAGVLERRGWGRSLSYRLTEAARERLADQAAGLLTPTPSGSRRR